MGNGHAMLAACAQPASKTTITRKKRERSIGAAPLARTLGSHVSSG